MQKLTLSIMYVMSIYSNVMFLSGPFFNANIFLFHCIKNFIYLISSFTAIKGLISAVPMIPHIYTLFTFKQFTTISYLAIYKVFVIFIRWMIIFFKSWDKDWRSHRPCWPAARQSVLFPLKEWTVLSNIILVICWYIYPWSPRVKELLEPYNED